MILSKMTKKFYAPRSSANSRRNTPANAESKRAVQTPNNTASCLTHQARSVRTRSLPNHTTNERVESNVTSSSRSQVARKHSHEYMSTMKRQPSSGRLLAASLSGTLDEHSRRTLDCKFAYNAGCGSLARALHSQRTVARMQDTLTH